MWGCAINTLPAGPDLADRSRTVYPTLVDCHDDRALWFLYVGRAGERATAEQPPPEQPPTITAATPMPDDDARFRPMEPDFSLVNLQRDASLPVRRETFT